MGTYTLPKSTEAPALARAAVQELVPEECVEDAALLVSELVSNGVKYGGQGEIELQLQTDPHCVRAEIIDQGHGFEPLTRASRKMTASDEGGWGLHLVDTLVDAPVVRRD